MKSPFIKTIFFSLSLVMSGLLTSKGMAQSALGNSAQLDSEVISVTEEVQPSFAARVLNSLHAMMVAYIDSRISGDEDSDVVLKSLFFDND